MGMFNLDNITTLAESLNRPAIVIQQARCSRVRNRNSSCNRCVEACKVNALEISDNEIVYSPSLCVNCGSCAAICPNEALLTIEPSKSELHESLFRAKEKNDTTLKNKHELVIVCARKLANAEIADGLVVEVPCLGHVDVSLLLEVAAAHSEGIVLVDGNCATCKLGWCKEQISSCEQEANALVCAVKGCNQQAGESLITRTSELPAFVLRKEESTASSYSDERRHFFRSTAEEMKRTALSAARSAIEDKLAPYQDTIYEQLKVDEKGTLSQFSMPRHMRALDALDSMSPPPTAQFDTSLFASVDIDVERCIACGMCATFCPTGAISHGAYLPGTRTVSRLDFLTCDCTACGLCADVCLKRCVSLNSQVSAGELLSFEPQEFLIGKQL